LFLCITALPAFITGNISCFLLLHEVQFHSLI
jgi:hypothetical protein